MDRGPRLTDDTTDVVGRDPARGWVVALGAWLAAGVSFGTLYTFGVFFREMSDDLDAGRGALALVYGITLLMFYGFGIVSGPLTDRWGPRPLLAVGAVSMTAGLLATSMVNSVTLGYLTYGVGVGLGGGLVITPVYSAVGAWFTHRRVLAMGLVGTGIGVGTVVLAPLTASVVQDHGWRAGFVALAAVVAVGLGLATILVTRPPNPTSSVPPPALRAIRGLLAVAPFRYVMISSFLFAVAVFAPFALVVPFAEDAGVVPTRAAWLTALIGASSVVGRIGITAFTGRFDQVRLVQACIALLPVSSLIWLLAGGRFVLLVAFVVLLGTAYGGYVSLKPSITIALFGSHGVGVSMGLMFLGAGLGGLTGPPVTGLVADLSASTAGPVLLVLVVGVGAFVTSLGIPLQRTGDTNAAPT